MAAVLLAVLGGAAAAGPQAGLAVREDQTRRGRPAEAAVNTPPEPPTHEPLGPSRRRSALAFSEIMYHPRERAAGRNTEFIEIYNSSPWPEDLGGWRLAGDVTYTFPPGSTIGPQAFLVIASSPADVETAYGLSGVLGGFTGSLNDRAGSLQMISRSGGVVLDADWSDTPPWPLAAGGMGHSLVLARPSYGESGPLAWAESAVAGGSPGTGEPAGLPSRGRVVINEVQLRSGPASPGYVELFNDSPRPSDISGCTITDQHRALTFRIPGGTILPPHGHALFDGTRLGTALSAARGALYLLTQDGTAVMDAVYVADRSARETFGRHPDGSLTLSPLAAPTPGTSNAPSATPDIVINEIMFHPVTGRNDDEYVELFNRGGQARDLGGWRLGGGIEFTFPKSARIEPGGHLVVARSISSLRRAYPALTEANSLGNYRGSLANGGERITLERPEMSAADDAAAESAAPRFAIVADVTYLDKSRWSRFADGGGSSLELVDARADARHPANWADSDEAAEGPWTVVETTGLQDHAMPDVRADQVQLFLLGEGEALVDDVEVIHDGANRVSNGAFERGADGWRTEGTHARSSWDPSARALHVRASDRGEPIGNRVRGALTAPVPPNATVTLRARVRWLRGRPEFLMRLRGGGTEAAARLRVTATPGTPGAPNSRARANAGPVIDDVAHRPVLPRPGQPVVVAARVTDPDGIAGVTLAYRLDPSPTLTAVRMRDDGRGGDTRAGDGIYSGALPPQPSGTMIAFHVEALDGAAAAAARRFPLDAPDRECLVRVGDESIPGPFATYRIWMTSATLDTWSTRGTLSNDPLDVTVVYGDHRVIYNAGARYTGGAPWSPTFTSPIGTPCAYDVLLPGGDEVLGENTLTLDTPMLDATNLRERLMHWIAGQYGLPTLHRRDVFLVINGVRRGTLYHDTQQPGRDVLAQWFPGDEDGVLFKTTQWSEGSDDGAPIGVVRNSLERFVSDGRLKTARYRWNWRLRASGTQLDYAPLFALVEAANASDDAYEAAIRQLVDVDDWMRMFAMNDLCAYWDAFGNPNGKNTYLYQTARDGWRLIPWDLDVGLGVFNDPPHRTLFPETVDPAIRRMYAQPGFVRAYWRELEFGVDAILGDPAITRWLTDRARAYAAAGLGFASPFEPSGAYHLSIPGWLEQRRTYLRTQLASVAAPFAAALPSRAADGSVLLRGTAPTRVKWLTVDGRKYPTTWTTVTEWAIRVPGPAGVQRLDLAGLDRDGRVTDRLTVTLPAATN